MSLWCECSAVLGMHDEPGGCSRCKDTGPERTRQSWVQMLGTATSCRSQRDACEWHDENRTSLKLLKHSSISTGCQMIVEASISRWLDAVKAAAELY